MKCETCSIWLSGETQDQCNEIDCEENERSYIEDINITEIAKDCTYKNRAIIQQPLQPTGEYNLYWMPKVK